MTAQYSTSTNNLPETSGEILPMAQDQMPSAASNQEKQAMSSELPPSSPTPPTGQDASAPLTAANPNPQTATPTAMATNPSQPSISAPSAADDVDLIEKEWVQRAKSLVAKTKDNPHQQNKEISKFKADYIKKRYNKEIKVSEG